MPSLFMRPVLAPPEMPGGQPSAPKLFAGVFFFPYVPIGVPIPSGFCRAGEQEVDRHCRPKRHKPPAAPEPSTMVLIGSGLALILWRYRTTGRPVAT